MERVLLQIKRLDIPFPQRSLIEQEIRQDLGFAEDRDQILSSDDVEELEKLHSTMLHRLFKHRTELQRTIETGVAFLPLALVIFLIKEEEKMIGFVREGGLGMYVILAIGVLLLGRELLSIFRLVLVKDHSEKNLRVDTPSVLLGCLALMLAGVGATALGVYVSAERVFAADIAWDKLVIGVKESITHLVLSSFLCALVILAHYGIRRTLHFWQAPITE